MKYYKILIVLALATMILIGLFPRVSAHAQEASVRISDGTWVVVEQPLTIPQLIARYAALYGVNREILTNVLTCESRLSASAVGDSGASYGVAQINLPSHPTISKEEALDPEFAINFAAKEFSVGHASLWSCYRILYL